MFPLPLVCRDNNGSSISASAEQLLPWSRAFRFLQRHAHPQMTTCSTYFGAGLRGGSGLRIWLNAMSRVVSAGCQLEWHEPNDAALAPLLVALWKLALDTPLSNSGPDLRMLHSVLCRSIPTGARATYKSSHEISPQDGSHNRSVKCARQGCSKILTGHSKKCRACGAAYCGKPCLQKDRKIHKQRCGERR